MACCQPKPLVRIFHTGKDVAGISERCAPVGLGYKPWVPGIHGEVPGSSPFTTILRSAPVEGTVWFGIGGTVTVKSPPGCFPKPPTFCEDRPSLTRTGVETGTGPCAAVREGRLDTDSGIGLETLWRCDEVKKSHKVL